LKEVKPTIKSELLPISLSSELKKLVNIQSLPRYEYEAKSYQISSYDTTGGNDDGFNGKYSFIRRNTDSTLVMFEAVGPGVIHRIWTPTPSEDTLDFYIDNMGQISFRLSMWIFFPIEYFHLSIRCAVIRLADIFAICLSRFKKVVKLLAEVKNCSFTRFSINYFPAGR
jgi:hypothetical protein